jgi:Na+/proline symporter
MRFESEKVRLAVSLSFLLCTIPYMGVVLYGPSLALGSGNGHNLYFLFKTLIF